MTQKHNIHVYPIFRVRVNGLQGTPDEMIAAAEMAVGTALNGAAATLRQLEVTGQGWLDIEYADGFDAALVDVVDGSRVIRSFTKSERHDTAKQHARTLDGLIDGESDELGEMLVEIRDFLETIR